MKKIFIDAKRRECNIIISNDKNFVSPDIQLLTSEEFYKEYIDDNNRK